MIPYEDDAVKQEFPRVDNAVDYRFPHENAEVELEFSSAPIVVEQGLTNTRAVAGQESPSKSVVV